MIFLEDPKAFQGLLAGGLAYLFDSQQPELLHAVTVIGQYLHSPSKGHMEIGKPEAYS